MEKTIIIVLIIAIVMVVAVFLLVGRVQPTTPSNDNGSGSNTGTDTNAWDFFSSLVGGINFSNLFGGGNDTPDDEIDFYDDEINDFMNE